MTLEAHLPPALRGPATVITPIAAGLSGAGVHRVEAGGEVFVLKVAAEGESTADWSRALRIQRLAAEHGVTPRVVHVDEPGRAVLTAFVADRSFPAFYMNPQTRETALDRLGRTVRRIHSIPIPDDVPARDPRAFLAQLREGFLTGTGFALPGFADEAIARVLAEDPPGPVGARVLGHNDLNPSNLIHDGESLLVVDWAAAGAADPFYDLAVLSVFLRMDEGTSLRLLAAYDGETAAGLPARFAYHRRLAAALAGSFQLFLARQLKHAGATDADTVESTLSLADFYARMRAGALRLGTAEGQWAFGLALLKEGLAV